MSEKVKHKRSESQAAARTITSDVAAYSLGEEVGRGGFAVVYRALNMETGEMVAVKRFPLDNVDDESLASIETEIELMKALDHENIVKYIDTVRTSAHLHIVLEFIENGSLQAVCSKFGNLSESLTAMYMTQVLNGLVYLHSQGVLHRDIKGANILTTKDGQVKLADFGVAMKSSDSGSSEFDVVGTPYWMAPEIIEMSAPTPACDIWSVGCTIIELLNGKPPYYDLAPMAALFRIVQDTYPPLPEGISEALRDFLLQCFQKEPMMRKTATQLLSHPWLTGVGGSRLGGADSSKAAAAAAGAPAGEGGDENPMAGFDDLDDGGDTFRPARPASGKPDRDSGGSAPADARARLRRRPGKQQRQQTAQSSTPAAPAQQAQEAPPPQQRQDSGGSANAAVSPQSGRPGKKLPLSAKERIAASRARGRGTASPRGSASTADNQPVSPASPQNQEQLLRQQQQRNAAVHRAPPPVPTRAAPPVPPQQHHQPGGNVSASTGGRSHLHTPSMAALDKYREAAEDEDDWGDDFGRISAAPGAGAGRAPPPQQMAPQPRQQRQQGAPHSSSASPGFDLDDAEDGLATIKLNPRSPNGGGLQLQADLQDDLSEWLETDSQRGGAGGSRSSPGPGGSGNRNAAGGLMGALNRSGASMLARFQESEGDEDFDDLGGASSDNNSAAGRGERQPKLQQLPAARRLPRGGTPEDSAGDDMDLDFDLDDGDGGIGGSPNGGGASDLAGRLRAKLAISSAAADNSGADDDDFLNYRFDEIDFQQNETKDVLDRQSRQISRLMENITQLGAMTPGPQYDARVVENCDQLLDIFDANTEQREHFMTRVGVLPVLEMLDIKSQSVLPNVLQVVNKIVEGSQRAQEQLSLLGMIPLIVRILEEGDDASPARLEAAQFVHQISSTSSLTLHMLIGAGGLPALVKLMSFSKTATRSADARTLVCIGVDCVLEVFSLRSTRSRDFCRLFVQLGLLPHLVRALDSMIQLAREAASPVLSPPKSTSRRLFGRQKKSEAEPSSGPEAQFEAISAAQHWKYAVKVSSIFTHFSRADAVVAEHMAQPDVLSTVMSHLRPPNSSVYDVPEFIEITETLLKCFKSISMEPTTLESLEQADSIVTLIAMLDLPVANGFQNIIIPSLFNMCRINKRRQSKAADAGIIPHLQRIIMERGTFKQLALQILCDLAHASASARDHLWHHNSVEFYLNLLVEEFWGTHALNSLSNWLANDVLRVEPVLVRSHNVEKLVQFFRRTERAHLGNIHAPFLDMIGKSSQLARALGRSGLYVQELLQCISTADAMVRRSLLGILQLLLQYHDHPRQMVLDYNLYQTVRDLASSSNQVLVRQKANQLLQSIKDIAIN